MTQTDAEARLIAAAERRQGARAAERAATEALRLACRDAREAGMSLYRIEQLTGLAGVTVRRWTLGDGES